MAVQHFKLLSLCCILSLNINPLSITANMDSLSCVPNSPSQLQPLVTNIPLFISTPKRVKNTEYVMIFNQLVAILVTILFHAVFASSSAAWTETWT